MTEDLQDHWDMIVYYAKDDPKDAGGVRVKNMAIREVDAHLKTLEATLKEAGDWLKSQLDTEDCQCPDCVPIQGIIAKIKTLVEATK